MALFQLGNLTPHLLRKRRMGSDHPPFFCPGSAESSDLNVLSLAMVPAYCAIHRRCTGLANRGREQSRLPAPSCSNRAAGKSRKSDAATPHSKRKLGREERFRTVISGMEPRRIAVVMLLPRSECLKPRHQSIAWCVLLSIELPLHRASVLGIPVTTEAAPSTIAPGPEPASHHPAVHYRRSSYPPPASQSG